MSSVCTRPPLEMQMFTGKVRVTEKRKNCFSWNSVTHTKNWPKNGASGEAVRGLGWESVGPSQEEEAALALAPRLIWVYGINMGLRKCRAARVWEGTRDWFVSPTPAPQGRLLALSSHYPRLFWPPGTSWICPGFPWLPQAAFCEAPRIISYDRISPKETCLLSWLSKPTV